MALDLRIRRKAREVLFNYTTNCRLLHESEQDILYGRTANRDHCYRRGGISNPTLIKAELLSSPRREEMRQQVEAVNHLIAALSTTRRIDRLQLKMLDMVYLRSNFSLIHAAIELEIGERTAKRWNSRLLEFIARDMGWMEETAAGKENR